MIETYFTLIWQSSGIDSSWLSIFLDVLPMALLVCKGVGFNFQGKLCLTSLVLYAKVFPIQSYTMNSSFFRFHLGSVKVYTDTWLIVLVRQQKAKKVSIWRMIFFIRTKLDLLQQWNFNQKTFWGILNCWEFWQMNIFHSHL